MNRINVNNINYIIKNENDVIQNVLLQKKQWNDNILNIIIKFIKILKLKHFVNVGTHIGTMSLPISKHISKVSSIEAYPPTYKHLCQNIKLNNIKNINTYNLAVGNTNETIYFMGENSICPVENKNRVKNNSGGMHVFTENDIKNNTRSSVLCDKKYSAQMYKFDELEIDNFDIMLVDIEGCEWEFLHGAKNKIIKNKPIIIIEIWSNNKRKSENMKTTSNQVINYISNLGYKLIKKIEDDYIFEPIN